jgi:hypothetical protein
VLGYGACGLQEGRGLHLSPTYMRRVLVIVYGVSIVSAAYGCKKTMSYCIYI